MLAQGILQQINPDSVITKIWWDRQQEGWVGDWHRGLGISVTSKSKDETNKAAMI